MTALRNILRAPLRSLMTVLGIAGGVALFVAISAIVADLQQQIAGAVAAYNLEIVVYEKRATSPFSSRIGVAQMDALREGYGRALTPVVVGTANEKWNAYAMVIGVEPAFAQRIPLVAGERFTAGSGEVMLGEINAQRLNLRPGGQIELDGQQRTVSGIYRTGSRLFDGGLMADIGAVQKILAPTGAAGNFTLALLRAEGGAGRGRMIAEIGERFPALRAVAGTEFAGALRLLKVVDAFSRTISVIALAGACLVVTNTLLMAIAERTREIGILMTVGWTPWRVLRMLAAESAVLCALGVVAGNALALALLQVVNRLDSVGFGWVPVRLGAAVIGESIAATTLVALLALAWPAAVLWRVQPLAALRHE